MSVNDVDALYRDAALAPGAVLTATDAAVRQLYSHGDVHLGPTARGLCKGRKICFFHLTRLEMRSITPKMRARNAIKFRDLESIFNFP